VIVAAHCLCEPLLFFFLRGDALKSMETCHRDLLKILVKTLAEAIELALDVDGGDSSEAAPRRNLSRFITSSQPL
jgi:hypothetical protein